MLKLLLTRNQEENIRYIYNDIKKNLENGIVSYLFVPDQYTLLSDINLMNALGVDSIIDVKIKSFTSFSNEILEKYGGIKRDIISDSGKSMLIKSILIEHSSDLKLYSKNIKSRGFVGELIQTINELKENNIKPDDLKEKIKAGNIDANLVKKLEDLIIVYEAYNERLKDHYIDNNDRLEILSEKLEDARELSDYKFYFTYFHDLNAKELSIIDKLVKLGVDITFSLILDPRIPKNGQIDSVDDGEIFITTYKLYNKLYKTCENCTEVINLNLEHDDEFSLLANNLFSYKPVTFKHVPKSFFLYDAASTEDEVRFLAETIKKGVIENGDCFSDFSIITTDESEYDRLISRVFFEENIPVFLDRKKKLSNNPIAKLLISILSLVGNKLNQDDVMHIVKFCFIKDYRTDVELFEKFIKSRKIRGNMYFEDKYFEVDKEYFENLSPNSKGEVIRLYESTIKIREMFIDLIDDYYLSHKEVKTINEHIKNLFRFLNSVTIGRAINDFIESQEEVQELHSQNTQVWDMFIFAIDQLSEISGDLSVNSDQFTQLLKDGLEEQKIGIVPPSQDVVLVGSILRTRANDSKTVFIVGLNDTYIPRRISSAGIISDEDKLKLLEYDIDLPIKEIEYRHEEMLSLYLNILRAGRVLYMTRSTMNSANEVMSPSIYYKQILKILPNITRITSYDFMDRIKYSEGYMVKRLIADLKDINNQQKEVKGDHYKYLGLYNYLNQNNLHYNKLNGMRLGLQSSELERLSTNTSEKLFERVKSMSISRVQTFSRCPYKHFIRYSIQPKEELDFDIDYFEIGNLAHGVMSKYIRDYKINPAKYNVLEKEDFNDIVESYMADDIRTLIDNQRKEDPKNKIILSFAKKSISMGAYNVTRQLSLSSFTPKVNEVVFGKSREIPGLIIDIGDKRIFLEGIIDRIDSLDVDGTEHLMVLDYKTGKQTFNLSLALAGIDVQLPIYLKAALNDTSSVNPKSPAGFFYLPIREELINTEVDDEEEILKQVIQELMMDGVVIRDEEIIRSIDKDIDTKSSVIRFRGNKSKFMEKDNVIEGPMLHELLDDVVNNTIEQVKKMIAGDIRAFPYIQNNISECANCDYDKFCKFSLRKLKKYRHIANRKWDEYKVIDDE